MKATEIEFNDPEQARICFEQMLSLTAGPFEFGRKNIEGEDTNTVDVRVEMNHQGPDTYPDPSTFPKSSGVLRRD